MLKDNCKAVLIGQEYHCDDCGVVWDMSDSDPEVCDQPKPTVHPATDPAVRIQEIRESICDQY